MGKTAERVGMIGVDGISLTMMLELKLSVDQSIGGGESEGACDLPTTELWSKTIEAAPSASMNRTILALEYVVWQLFMTLVALKCAPARCPVPMRALVVTNQVVSCALHKSSTPCSS